jgi:hypothetical protein
MVQAPHVQQIVLGLQLLPAAQQLELVTQQNFVMEQLPHVPQTKFNLQELHVELVQEHVIQQKPVMGPV